MICKWCGEPVKTGSKICRRCKREIPALSDCGGFYDLVQESAPVLPPIPEKPLVSETPIRPELPERKKSSPLMGIICGAAILLALIFLIQTIYLSGKLADATEEADRLRDQLKTKEEVVVNDPTAPIDPTINGFEQKDPEPTKEPEVLTKIPLILCDGTAEIQLNTVHNLQLSTGILHFTLRRDGEEDALLTFTLQRRSAGKETEEIFLQITPSEGVAIYGVQWRGSGMTELPSEEDGGSLFDHFFNSPDAITELAQPVAELGEGENICTLTGEDENGEELTITIYGIVIE